MYRVKIDVTLKKAVLDPQGKTVAHALHSMGFAETKDVRVGKFIDVTLNVPSKEAAHKSATAMCDRLLVNPVIEDYTFTIEEMK